MPSKKRIAGIVIAFIFAILGYIYFFIVSPIFVSKPELEKPLFTGNVTETQVEWIASELGAYKLQNNAEIEFIVDGKVFSVRVENSKPVAKLGNASDPDLRIYASREAFERILNTSDFREEIFKLYESGEVKIEIFKPVEELILKGYKAIYDELQGK